MKLSELKILIEVLGKLRRNINQVTFAELAMVEGGINEDKKDKKF